jgi:hypothetical protein
MCSVTNCLNFITQLTVEIGNFFYESVNEHVACVWYFEHAPPSLIKIREGKSSLFAKVGEELLILFAFGYRGTGNLWICRVGRDWRSQDGREHLDVRVKVFDTRGCH